MTRTSTRTSRTRTHPSTVPLLGLVAFALALAVLFVTPLGRVEEADAVPVVSISTTDPEPAATGASDTVSSAHSEADSDLVADSNAAVGMLVVSETARR